MDIYTIGHSNHSIQEFIELLNKHNIQTLVDIRTYPGSRYCPWFNQGSFPSTLRESGIGYTYISRLGGRRSIQVGIDPKINTGWSDPSFKNYADYTLSTSYNLGLQELLQLAKYRKIAYMCCEKHPKDCHRLLVSNTLKALGHNVQHILFDGELEEHRLNVHGAPVHIEKGVVTYPKNEPVQLTLNV